MDSGLNRYRWLFVFLPPEAQRLVFLGGGQLSDVIKDAGCCPYLKIAWMFGGALPSAIMFFIPGKTNGKRLKRWVLAKLVPLKSPFSPYTCNSLARIGSRGHPDTIHQTVTRRGGLGGVGGLASRRLLAKERL